MRKIVFLKGLASLKHMTKGHAGQLRIIFIVD